MTGITIHCVSSPNVSLCRYKEQYSDGSTHCLTIRVIGEAEVDLHGLNINKMELFAEKILRACRAEREAKTGDMGEDTVSLAPTQQAKQLSMAEQAALGVACGTSRAS